MACRDRMLADFTEKSRTLRFWASVTGEYCSKLNAQFSQVYEMALITPTDLSSALPRHPAVAIQVNKDKRGRISASVNSFQVLVSESAESIHHQNLDFLTGRM